MSKFNSSQNNIRKLYSSQKNSIQELNSAMTNKTVDQHSRDDKTTLIHNNKTHSLMKSNIDCSEYQEAVRTKASRLGIVISLNDHKRPQTSIHNPHSL